MRPANDGIWARSQHFLTMLLLVSLLFMLDIIVGCGDDEEKEPAVYYGPPPIDGQDAPSVDDADAAPSDTGEPVAYYGPQLVDAADATPDTGSDVPMAYYGPQIVDVMDDAVSDVPNDCMPMAYYGPQPCSDDQQCIDQNGAGWYCNTTNTFDDGCGGTSTWPICEQQ